MKLKPEYQRHLTTLKLAYPTGTTTNHHGCMEEVIVACQALANKPQVRLSVTRIYDVYHAGKNVNMNDSLLSVQEAILAAQREPEEIPFDYQKWIEGGWEPMLNGCPVDAIRNDCNYTMRRKP